MEDSTDDDTNHHGQIRHLFEDRFQAWQGHNSCFEDSSTGPKKLFLIREPGSLKLCNEMRNLAEGAPYIAADTQTLDRIKGMVDFIGSG